MIPAEALRQVRILLETHKDGAAFRTAVRELLRDLDTPPMFDEHQPKARTVHRTDEPWTTQDLEHGRHVELPGSHGFQGPPHDRHWLEPRLFTDPPEPGSIDFENPRSPD